MMTRTFIAAIPPPEIRETVRALFTETERLEVGHTIQGAHWTDDADLHCTLLFLGGSDLAATTEALVRAAPSLSATRAQLAGTTGLLGGDALVVPIDGLDTLAASLTSQVGRLVNRDTRQHSHFFGHLTVGRGMPTTTASSLIGRHVPPDSWTVSAISLMTNRISGVGYRTVQTVSLLN